jgi:hypothetical protein
MRQWEIEEKRREEEWDWWFNQARPMAKKWTWREKRLTKEDSDASSDGEGSSWKPWQGKNFTQVEGDKEVSQANADMMDVNMVFIILEEFGAPEGEVAELTLGAERVVFKKPLEAGKLMKPLFIKGHLDDKPMGHRMVDGTASVNIMPLDVFKKLGHDEGDMKKTNLRLSGFSGEPTMARGIVSIELTIGSKTAPATFFMVNVKGQYNIFLSHDWVHANECVWSTLHQCLMQWVGDCVDVVGANEAACVTMAEPHVDI